MSHGVKDDKILFLNLIAAPAGIQAVTKKYSKIKIVTACVDKGLDSKKYIVPGLGDFGELFCKLFCIFFRKILKLKFFSFFFF